MPDAEQQGRTQAARQQSCMQLQGISEQPLLQQTLQQAITSHQITSRPPGRARATLSTSACTVMQDDYLTSRDQPATQCTPRTDCTDAKRDAACAGASEQANLCQQAQHEMPSSKGLSNHDTD
jgi:hypothetical protein